MNSSIKRWSFWASGRTFPSKCSSSSWSVGSNLTPAGSPGNSWIPVCSKKQNHRKSVTVCYKPRLLHEKKIKPGPGVQIHAHMKDKSWTLEASWQRHWPYCWMVVMVGLRSLFSAHRSDRHYCTKSWYLFFAFSLCLSLFLTLPIYQTQHEIYIFLLSPTLYTLQLQRNLSWGKKESDR